MARTAPRIVKDDGVTLTHRDNERHVVVDHTTKTTTVTRLVHRRWKMTATDYRGTTTITVGNHVLAELDTEVSADRTLIRFIKSVDLNDIMADVPSVITREQHAMADAMVASSRLMAR